MLWSNKISNVQQLFYALGINISNALHKNFFHLKSSFSTSSQPVYHHQQNILNRNTQRI